MSSSADQIRVQLQAQASNPDATVARAAVRALTELEVRFSSGVGPRPTAADAGCGSDAPGAHRRRGRAPSRAAHAADSGARGRAGGAAGGAAAASANAWTSRRSHPGDVIEGRYKYIEKIGRGAFGTVLLMEDTVVEERLILKFLNPNVAQDEEIMKRFVHELRYSRKITHRNVIRIYDFLYIQGNYAISMEYFPSHTLGSEIVNEKPLALKRALQFGIDIATGMAVAHQVGIVHRDLKPANVLINDECLLKIVDFGVAAAQREGDTQLTRPATSSARRNTWRPSRFSAARSTSARTSTRSGVIMYEMLTGVPPYSRGDHMAVMYQHVQGKARAPQEINPTAAGQSGRGRGQGHGGGQGQALPDHGRVPRRSRALPVSRAPACDDSRRNSVHWFKFRLQGLLIKRA